jgi:hypothetical protein
MEDVLEVYQRPHDPDYPLVCVDESSKQLIKETRSPIPMKPGQPARYDYEYERNGTANLFMMFAPLEGWRHVKVTDRHAAVDYAHVTHGPASLYEAFPAEEARHVIWSNGSSGIIRPSMAAGSQGQLAIHHGGRSCQTQASLPFVLTDSGDQYCRAEVMTPPLA